MNIEKDNLKRSEKIFDKAIETMGNQTKEKASKTLYKALVKIAELSNHSPKHEVIYSDLGEGIQPRDLHVLYEACPIGERWGVELSMCRFNNFYLETYYGIDVIFCNK